MRTEEFIKTYVSNYDDNHVVFARVPDGNVFVVKMVRLSGENPAPRGTAQEFVLEPHVNYEALARLTVANTVGCEAGEVHLLTCAEAYSLPPGTELWEA
jgi:hypothetical protein